MQHDLHIRHFVGMEDHPPSKAYQHTAPVVTVAHGVRVIEPGNQRRMAFINLEQIRQNVGRQGVEPIGKLFEYDASARPTTQDRRNEVEAGERSVRLSGDDKTHGTDAGPTISGVGLKDGRKIAGLAFLLLGMPPFVGGVSVAHAEEADAGGDGDEKAAEYGAQERAQGLRVGLDDQPPSGQAERRQAGQDEHGKRASEGGQRDAQDGFPTFSDHGVGMLLGRSALVEGADDLKGGIRVRVEDINRPRKLSPNCDSNREKT